MRAALALSAALALLLLAFAPLEQRDPCAGPGTKPPNCVPPTATPRLSDVPRGRSENHPCWAAPPPVPEELTDRIWTVQERCGGTPQAIATELALGRVPVATFTAVAESVPELVPEDVTSAPTMTVMPTPTATATLVPIEVPDVFAIETPIVVPAPGQVPVQLPPETIEP
jgi:hypothetical protein